MRVLTYNIWNYAGGWRERRWRLAETIASADADVVALQEVRHNWNDRPGWNQARWLAGQLGYHWVFRRANVFMPLPPVVEGLAFLSRRPVEGLDWISVPKRGRGPKRIILRSRYGALDLYNVHYPLSEGVRRRESNLLIDALTRIASPALVLGDFNADAWDEPMRALFAAGLQDLWAEVAGSKAWPQKRRIDYVLARGMNLTGTTIQTVGESTGGSRTSDHPGLLVDIPNIPDILVP